MSSCVDGSKVPPHTKKQQNTHTKCYINFHMLYQFLRVLYQLSRSLGEHEHKNSSGARKCSTTTMCKRESLGTPTRKTRIFAPITIETAVISTYITYVMSAGYVATINNSGLTIYCSNIPRGHDNYTYGGYPTSKVRTNGL